MIGAQGIDGDQNYGRCSPGCQGKRGKGPQNTNEDLLPKPPNSFCQNWKRKEKFMTLEVEDPLK
jgi:hypothetical protein